MTDPQMVTIRKNIYPDVQVIIPKENRYSDQDEYLRLSLVISESIIIEEECNEEGAPISSYREPGYIACRIYNDVIQTCDTRHGWIPANEKLNDEYKSILAEKALLEERTNG